MAHLQHILYQVSLVQTIGSTDREIHALQLDSRKVQPGDLFIAIKGQQADGHQFIPMAIAAGATTILC